MKKAYLSIVCLVLALSVLGQDKSSAELLSFSEQGFDFGRIPQGKPVHHVFKVTNLGKEPMLIENVQASCGCTTPEWNRESIAPGKTAEIKVGYNSAAEGSFEKTITVFYNKGQVKTLTIKGHVWRIAESTAPRNSSIAILKNVN